VSDPQIVVTGLGANSAAGPDNQAFVGALSEGGGTFSALPAPLDLIPPGFGGVATYDRKVLRSLPGTRPLRPATMTRYTFLSTIGLGLAMTDAGVDADPDDDEAIRRSLFIGSYVNLPEMHKYVGMSHLARDRDKSARGEYAVDDAKVMLGMKRFTAFEFLRLMNNMPVGHGSIQARCKGPCNTYMGFVSAGLQAVGAGFDTLRDGLADQALCGGAGSAVIEHALTYKGYRGLLTDADDPATACAPFDRSASGIVPGEGAGFVVLETRDHADARGARPRAVIRGWAHGFAVPTGPRGFPTDHEVLARVIRAALGRAGVAPGDLDLLVPTAYGLPQMDALEVAAYRQVLGDHLDHIQPLFHGRVTGFAEAAHGALGLTAAVAALDADAPVRGWQPSDPIDGWPTPPSATETPKLALVTAFAMEGSAAAVVVERA